MLKKIVLLISIFVMSYSSMDAQHISDFTAISGIAARELGDSISNIITKNDNIVAKLTVWENDTLPDKEMTPCMRNLVVYTLCQPSMYKSDMRVYSAFYADARLDIFSEGTFVTLELDYSIYKWRLIDNKGKQLCRHDLPDQNLLSLLHMLWQESKLINIKYGKYINAYEK